MSDCICIQPGLVSTWEVYPRVFYFRGRYLDLHKRFNRIIGALPKVLHNHAMMTNLRELSSLLENKYINMITIGKEKLTPDELYVCKEQLEDTKTTNPNSPDQTFCLTIIICHATIDALDDAAVSDVVLVTQNVPSSLTEKCADPVDSVLIVCKVKSPFTEEESRSFQTDVLREVQLSKSFHSAKFDVMVVTETSTISTRMSALYEKRIINAFLCILSNLSLFIPDNKQETQRKMKLLDHVSVINRISEILRNGLSPSETEKTSFPAEFLSRLARVVKCSIISPISSEYKLPPWVCNRLLHEIQFEEDLMMSVSENTKYYLSKFKLSNLSNKHIAPGVGSGKRIPRRKLMKSPKNISRDVIIDSIQKDFEKTTVKAEKVMSSMESLTSVMKKMVFEINGYLKQTLVEDVQPLQIQPQLKIPEKLRQEILSIQGVGGTGTLYGQFEVHIHSDNQTATAEIERQLKLLMKRHHFHHPYTIRAIKQ